jgi:hypothetical protein
LKEDNRLLDVYRAISNPAYICHTSTDPILTAFELNEELMECAPTETEFHVLYLDLANKVRVFAVDLIGWYTHRFVYNGHMYLVCCTSMCKHSKSSG